MQFSPFFVFRPWPKRCFCCFLLFGDARKSIFSVFSLSVVPETLFLLFSAHPSPRKAIFYRFLLIRALGKPFFSVFCSSEPSESHFSLFSAHPRPRKAIFFCFLLIRALGKPFFSVFCSSETSESCFFISAAPAELRFYGLHCKGKKNIAYKKMMFSF